MFRVFSKPPAATIWISRPSRIHAVPSPKMTIQWNRVQGMPCMRAGIMLLIGFSCSVVAAVMRPPRPDRGARMPQSPNATVTECANLF